MRDVTVPFDGKTKSFWCLVAPFLERAFLLQPVERAVHLDATEVFRAKPEPLFLWRVAVEIVAPAFVIPAAGADVCFAGHEANNVGGASVPRPNLVFVKQPRPRICHQVFSGCAASIPFFRSFNEPFGDWILLDVASHELELFAVFTRVS